MEIAKEEKASSKKWSTIELRKALVGMVNIRESVFQFTKHFHVSQSSSQSFNSQGDKSQKYENFINNENFRRFEKINQTRSFPVTTNEKNIICYFCVGNHWSSSCTNILGVEDHKKRLIEQERCFRCLRKGHISKNCYIRKNCSYCNGPHNAAICSRRIYLREKPNFNNENMRQISY